MFLVKLKLGTPIKPFLRLSPDLNFSKNCEKIIDKSEQISFIHSNALMLACGGRASKKIFAFEVSSWYLFGEGN